MDEQPINPYQSPDTQSEYISRANLQQPHLFRETKIFAWLAGLCIAFTIPYTIVIFLLSQGMLVLEMDQLTSIDLLKTIIFTLGVIFYCIWKYRCACNARALSGMNLTYSPGWCVGYNFIPILSLFRPYQCMNDIFAKTYYALNRSYPKWLILSWWWSWILYNIFDRVAAKSESIEVTIACEALGSISAVLVIMLMTLLTRAQYEMDGRSGVHAH